MAHNPKDPQDKHCLFLIKVQVLVSEHLGLNVQDKQNLHLDVFEPIF